ncbi:MAG: Hsp20/alpha crystallin family protein [Acidobacteriota bacterium]
MTLVRFDPFRDLRTVHDRIDRLFNDAVARRSGEGEEEPLRASWLPAVDVHENEQQITLRAELPGMTEDDIQLTIDKGRLTVQGEKRLEKEDTDGDYRRIESSYGSFYRSFPLPDTVDQDNINANFKNGVLYVTLPKTEAAKPKRIELKIN